MSLKEYETLMETTMYDNLLLLPLFQGLSKNDFTTILEKVRFHFLTYQEGETFIRQGETCQQLCFLLNGKAIARTTDKEHAYTLSEPSKHLRLSNRNPCLGYSRHTRRLTRRRRR